MWTTTTMYTFSGILMPTASITSKKSRLKVYENSKIYLKDNSNFEIELHNPTRDKYLAKIYINGKELSKSGIIINPGQRVFLERYIDTDSKFLFKTFEVDDVKETEAARAQNGLVEVKFFKENIQPYFYDIVLYASTPLVGYDNYSNQVISSTSLSSTSTILLNESNNKSIETGRVFEGEKSQQKFQSATGSFQEIELYKYVYHLLPESAKAIEAQEIRHYCSNCGIRIKKTSWKFCPTCGEKL